MKLKWITNTSNSQYEKDIKMFNPKRPVIGEPKATEKYSIEELKKRCNIWIIRVDLNNLRE